MICKGHKAHKGGTKVHKEKLKEAEKKCCMRCVLAFKHFLRCDISYLRHQFTLVIFGYRYNVPSGTKEFFLIREKSVA